MDEAVRPQNEINANFEDEISGEATECVGIKTVYQPTQEEIISP